MLEKLLPKRLDIQVVIICGMMILLFVPAYLINEARQEIDYVIDTIKLETKVVAQNIALTSSKYLVIRDYSSLENLLIRSAAFPGVIGIQITDPLGNVISDVIKTDTKPEARFSVTSLEVPAENKPVIEIAEGSNELFIFEPIVSGSSIGWVRLHYELEQAQLHAKNRFQEYLVDVTILTLVLIMLLFAFLRKPMRMIREAADFAGRMTDKTGEQIPVCTQSDELNKLSVALNNASGDLHQQEMAINQALKDLEMQKLALDEHSIVAITDERGGITYANKKFLEVTGYECEELQGVNLRILNSGFHPTEFFDEMWTTISVGKIWRDEILNTNKSGKRIWLSASIIPFIDDKNKPYQYILICTDITALKSAERQLERKNRSLEELTDHLEDMVKQRTEELETANTKLLHLNKIKSEFVSVVSHELRTPLTSIKSFAEILEDDIEDMEPDTQRRYLRIINDESDRLGRLINDVLDLQKIDAGMMSWNDSLVNFEDLVKSKFEVFEQAVKAKGLDYELTANLDVSLVEIDPDKISQVISNILSNALKFTSKGKISLSLTERVEESETDGRQSWILTKICDTGFGIPAEEVDNVFKRFHQVDSSETREQGGSGLGLNICKEIIEHYNGQIWAESEPGKGSCFCFKLKAVNNE